jgi:SAM-dependent methyltransferase
MWRRWTSGATGRWAFWKFNWLANHKVIRALEHVRGHARGELLDVGCGSMPFAGVLEDRVTRYVGVDLPGSHDFWGAHPHVYGLAETLPFRDASFDTLLSVSLLNYLPEPGRMIAEARRLLRPDGILLLEFPQTMPLDDEDRDYFRFTRHGAELLLRANGFEPLEYVPIGSLPARVGLSTIGALGRLNRGPTRVLTEIPVRLLYVVVQLASELLDRLFFNPDEVLAHLVVARRIP